LRGLLIGWVLLGACVPASVSGPRDTAQVAEDAPGATVHLADTPHSEPLRARISLDEPDGSPWTVRRSWTRDGVPTAFTTAQIPASETAPDQVWELTATVSGDSWTTTAVGSATVTNTAPRLIAPRVTPELRRATSTLRFEYADLVDDEGDPATVSWSWWVDGVEHAVDGPLPPSSFDGGQQVVLRAVTSDGYDERVTELPVTIPDRKLAVDLVVVVDVTGSTHREFPALAWALRDLATRAHHLAGPEDRIGLVTYAWKHGYEYTPLFHPLLEPSVSDTWGALEHASRIRGDNPDPDDDGFRPHMPREYDGEQGSDPHVGLDMARTMLTEHPHDDRELVILLVTDGEPLPVKSSSVRERIGYVEDRWRFVEGVAPHSSGEIADVTVATAESAWRDEGISIFVVSVRDTAPFLRQTVQGLGTWQLAAHEDQPVRAFATVVHTLPWGGE